MKKWKLRFLIFLFGNSLFLTISSQDISLPAPDRTGGKPLMQALNERQSIRTFTKDSLTQQQLSDLLWAGWGISIVHPQTWRVL